MCLTCKCWRIFSQSICNQALCFLGLGSAQRLKEDRDREWLSLRRKSQRRFQRRIDAVFAFVVVPIERQGRGTRKLGSETAAVFGVRHQADELRHKMLSDLQRRCFDKLAETIETKPLALCDGFGGEIGS